VQAAIIQVDAEPLSNRIALWAPIKSRGGCGKVQEAIAGPLSKVPAGSADPYRYGVIEEVQKGEEDE
jgi:hypothetical protein